MVRDDQPHYVYELHKLNPDIDQSTLVNILHRLERDGYVEACDGPQSTRRGYGLRHYFRATDAGRAYADTVALPRLRAVATTLERLNVRPDYGDATD